jgi:hypothetical protein
MSYANSHTNGLISAVPNQLETAQELRSETQVASLPLQELTPLLSKFLLQGGSILVFLILIWLLLQQLNRLLQALTSLVKAIKQD